MAFPPELVYEILSRVPIKSLARFRCVCKSWLEYMKEPYFETIHVKEPTPIMLEQFPSSSCSDKNKQCIISLLCVIQGTTSQVLQKEPVLEFCYKSRTLAGVRENIVLGSCNGLTLVCYERDPVFRMAVINPLSKEWHPLPPISNIYSHSYWWEAHEGAAGIGFDDSTNTFKTVFVILKTLVHEQKQLCAMVHCSGSSWREIPQIPAFPISGGGVFGGHGRLYWLVSGFDSPSSEPYVGRKIVWFDVKDEKFGLTEPPKPKGGDWSTGYQLVDLNGEVGFAYVVGICIELWILKHQELWVLHCRFDVSRIPPQHNNVEVSGYWNKDGDILLTCGGGTVTHLFVYTLKTGDLRGVDLADPCECKADIRIYPSNFFPVRLKCLFG